MYELTHTTIHAQSDVLTNSGYFTHIFVCWNKCYHNCTEVNRLYVIMYYMHPKRDQL